MGRQSSGGEFVRRGQGKIGGRWRQEGHAARARVLAGLVAEYLNRCAAGEAAWIRAYQPRYHPEIVKGLHDPYVPLSPAAIAVARDEYAAWLEALPLLSDSAAELPKGRLSATTLDGLSQLAARPDARFALTFGQDPKRGRAGSDLVPTEGASNICVVLRLLSELIRLRGLSFLRRCPTCTKWFVDPTNNQSKLRCGPSCTNQFWSRDQRRAAHHAQYGTRTKKTRRIAKRQRRGRAA